MGMMESCDRQQKMASSAAELAVWDIAKGRSWWRDSVLNAGYHRHLAYEMHQTWGIANDAALEMYEERRRLRESTTMYSQP